MLGNGRRTPQSTPSAESALSKTGTVARSLSSPGEKSPKSNWEVSDSTPNSKSVLIVRYQVIWQLFVALCAILGSYYYFCK